MSVQSCHNRMISFFAQDMLRLSHLQALFIVEKKRLHRSHVYVGPLTWCGLSLACLDSKFGMHLRFGGPDLGWFWSPPRTESRSCHCKLSEMLCSGPILQTSTIVESKALPTVCNTLPVASCGDMTETFDRFKRSRTARANSLLMWKSGKLEASLRSTHSATKSSIRFWSATQVCREAQALVPPGQGVKVSDGRIVADFHIFMGHSFLLPWWLVGRHPAAAVQPTAAKSSRRKSAWQKRLLFQRSINTYMTWEYTLDVFGALASWPQRQIIWVYGCCVLDTLFDPRYDVTKPFVLTRVRHDVSAGKWVVAMISPPQQHASCSSKKIFPLVRPSQACFSVLAMRWTLQHPMIRVWETCRKCKLLRHSLVWLGHAESGSCFW